MIRIAQEDRPMEPLFPSLTCQVCGGSMTKVSENEAVCMNDETHKRKIEHNHPELVAETKLPQPLEREKRGRGKRPTPRRPGRRPGRRK